MLLHQQGMLSAPTRAAKKADVLACIRRMGLLQIDTIHVVARSPYLVLFSRLGDYEPRWLEELQSAGKLFEYWSHALCWLPMESLNIWRSRSEHNMRDGMASHGRIQEWLAKNKDVAAHVLERIRAEGPLRSADFENESRGSGGWWEWKREKIALEYLFYAWTLMVVRRVKFQRLYDLAERVAPWDRSKLLPPESIYDELVYDSALRLGVASEPWLRDYYRLRQDRCKAAIARLLEGGRLQELRIEGLKGRAYVAAEFRLLLNKAQAGKLLPERTALLSPFDPIVWHRQRASELFGFDYLIECYTPEHKRVYGYFTLPILQRDALIGRVDAKAHRSDGVFELRAVHLEAGIKPDARDVEELAAAIQSCADWHRCPQVKVTKSDPPGFAAKLRKALAARR